MSLAIAVKVPEGLVLAAESRVSYDLPVGETKRLVTFDNATKLLEFDGYKNFGAITFGIGNIGTRTAHSFLSEFIEHLKKNNVSENVKVKTFAKRMGEFYSNQWKSADMKNIPDGQNMVFVVGGFDRDDAHAKVYQILVPGNPEPEEVKLMKQFNSVWGGQQEIVARMVRGYDDRLIKWLDENIKFTDEQIKEFQQLIGNIELPIFYSAFGLQDAINLAESFIQTTIDMQNLSAEMRGVGGAIDIAVITKESGFNYIQKKTLTGKMKTKGNQC
jgi:hypothetical protein